VTSVAERPILEQSEPRSLAEKAYELLVRKIVRLELPPGTVLAEKTLMAEFGIGRTPIREAMQRLAVEGLLHHLPNRGMFVSEISATSVQQIYEFRGLIDGYVARLAATRASREDVDNLANLHTALVQATEDDDVDRYVALDRTFYQVLARAATNTYLAEVIPRIFNLHLRLWFFIAQKSGSWHPIATAHEEMTKGVADAVRRGDPDAAELAMKVYISRRHQDIRDIM
jgi:DNA-binding GntR family transcriptional regulator